MPEIAVPAEELETWENISASRHVLKKFSAKGDLRDEMIGGKKKFHLSTRERKINQELAARPERDPFQNGRFSPVKLVDSADDLEEIASNPNLMGEADMVALVKLNTNTMKKRLEDVTNVILVSRILEVAKAEDVSIGKVDAIQARLDEISPTQATEVELR